MIRGTVFLTTKEAKEYKKYCNKHEINMLHVRDTTYVFVMKSKKLAKFMRFAKACSNSEIRKIELAD